jgi:hypothetical protein
LDQFVTEKKDRLAPEPVDHRIGPYGGDDDVAVEALQGVSDFGGGVRGVGFGLGHEFVPPRSGGGAMRRT